MLVHNFDPVLLDFGFLQIRWYSISYILGILMGWAYARTLIRKMAKQQNYSYITHQNIDDSIVYLILGIIIGGRLGYVLFYNFNYYLINFVEIIMIWKGGMSFHGGLIGVIISLYVYTKRKQINFLRVADIIACVAPIGIFFGRIANFINGELYGKITNLPWAIYFPYAGELPRHPSQIYEALLEGIVLFALINFFALKKRGLLRPGYISSIFIIFYSIFRIFSELFREPDQHLGYIYYSLSTGMILSIFMLFCGFIILLKVKKL